MPEEKLTPTEEAKATPTEENGSEDSELENLFEEESEEEEAQEGPVKKLEAKIARMEKGMSKYFSQKGRENKAPNKAEEPKATPTQASDDVTELFLESKPEAELVKDDLKTVADAKYGGSIIKAWKGEQWLHAKAEALSEENKAKSKIQSPSNQIEGETDFAKIDKLPDAQQAEAIKKMSDKDYSRWQDYQRKKSTKGGMIEL